MTMKCSALVMRCLFAVIFIKCQLVISSINSICPNRCSGFGVCRNSSVGNCDCFPSYTGFDCSLRVCPAATAWVDLPSADNTAHGDYAECSNMGTCDRRTGVCNCRVGFGGPACERMLCPVGPTPTSILDLTFQLAPCSSNGRCVSLGDATRYQTFESYLEPTYYTGWDADKIFGCVCDDGWEGIACQKRTCPKGDDPLTIGVDEVQLIDCQCTSCTGGMYITFKGQQTSFIPYDAPEELIHYHLRQLDSVKLLEVQMLRGERLCSPSGSVTKVTFKLPQGPQPVLTTLIVGGLKGESNNMMVRSKGQYSLIQHDLYSVTGTKEFVQCSDRGVCNNVTGICRCFDGFRSSDGLGGPGNIDDCGHRFREQFNYTVNSTIVSTRCPFVNGAVCSGHGSCDESIGTCACDSGYGGSACANRTCSTFHTWFGMVDDEHVSVSECGGIGECDGDTGLCTNCGGSFGLFGGDRCEYLTCPTNSTGSICSENGACLSLREIAQLHYNEEKELSGVAYDTPWDADSIRGCLCDRAISVDNQYSLTYRNTINFFTFNASSNSTMQFTDQDIIKFYRGPYAFAATDFKGYACSQALCPKGDNPRTYGVNEIQQLVCRANNGSFMLTFRENTTHPISYNSSVEEFQSSLNDIYTIGSVSVTTEGGHDADRINGSICNQHGNITVNIEFLTEFGDLPMLRADLTGIDNVGIYIGDFENEYIMNITESQKGTKEDMECSGQGVCNENTGVCSCFEGFMSSNGSITSPGERGECAYLNPFSTQKFVRGR